MSKSLQRKIAEVVEFSDMLDELKRGDPVRKNFATKLEELLWELKDFEGLDSLQPNEEEIKTAMDMGFIIAMNGNDVKLEVPPLCKGKKMSEAQRILQNFEKVLLYERRNELAVINAECHVVYAKLLTGEFLHSSVDDEKILIEVKSDYMSVGDASKQVQKFFDRFDGVHFLGCTSDGWKFKVDKPE